MKYDNEQTLKNILGNEKFKKMSEYTLREVKKKFGKQDLKFIRKIVYDNNTNVLIVSILKGLELGYKNNIKEAYITTLTSRDYYLETKMEKVIERYSEYVEIILEYMKNENN